MYNPLEQRDFWYLFRKRALPQETREYIPKIIASIIIHQNAEKYGFEINDDLKGNVAFAESYDKK